MKKSESTYNSEETPHYFAMKKINYKLLFHRFFKFVVIIKGIDGIVDVLASVILFVFWKHSLATIIPYLVRKELIHDPQDFIANYLIYFSHNILPGTQIFVMLYLFLHGIIKIWLAFALLSKNNKIHKIASVILILFVGYEIYRYSHTGSYILLGATLFDILTILLIQHEYKKIIHKKKYS